jgi:uncharacterized membrane protein YgcG
MVRAVEGEPLPELQSDAWDRFARSMELLTTDPSWPLFISGTLYDAHMWDNALAVLLFLIVLLAFFLLYFLFTHPVMLLRRIAVAALLGALVAAAQLWFRGGTRVAEALAFAVFVASADLMLGFRAIGGWGGLLSWLLSTALSDLGGSTHSGFGSSSSSSSFSGGGGGFGGGGASGGW